MYSNYTRRGVHDLQDSFRDLSINAQSESSNNSGSKPASENIWKEDDKIMIGIDIGSTQSAVAFSFLQQDLPQTIYRVARWPGHPQPRLPTLIWYDENGKAVLYGARAASLGAKHDAATKGWTLAKHFKLHLHPNEMRAKGFIKLYPLPNGVSLHQIYVDFLVYLLEHTKPRFEEKIPNGVSRWERYRSEAVFVIAHPNGWGIREQEFLRRAAIDAELVDAETANSRIRFVTEAEASVHHCIRNSDFTSTIQPGLNFAVCDAGGSTIDTTVYTVTAQYPILKLAEKRDSACIQAGGIHVDEEAQKCFEKALRTTNLAAEDIQEHTEECIQEFEISAKRSFVDESEEIMLKFFDRSISVRDGEVIISRGIATLPGTTVQSFFDHCVNKIVASIDEQIRGIHVSNILLVGGFGDSPYLQTQLQSRYNRPGCQVITANETTYESKAVAEGALMWGAVTSVFRRAPRWSFGIQGYKRFDNESRGHAERTTFMGADGYEKVSGIWCEIAKKGIALDADFVYRQPFVRTYGSPNPNLATFEIALYSYSGNDQPQWLRSRGGALLEGFQNVCLITADLRSMSRALESKIGPRGKRYWSLPFFVCLKFGDTQLRAYIEWEEKGQTRYGPMAIVPEDIDEF